MNERKQGSQTRYEGVLSSEVRIQLTDLLKAMAVANIQRRTNVKKLCTVAIELLDNAQRYCSSGTISCHWELQEDCLVIRIENRANQADAERLLSTVAAVNAMTSEELVQAFRSQLGNGEFGEKGGAGLGFLDIARKVSVPIEAQITPTSSGEFLCRSTVSTSI